ncbi:MAG: Apolipoprotein N-acyltransferase [Chlamydiales bacterium]|nr:Apolipoprotein N-acyltransferase [Chlamydiales bacterium]
MKRTQPLYFFASFLLVASAQPDWSVLACLATSAFGYALFWKGMLRTQGQKKRLLSGIIWFAAIQAVQLSWLATDRYVGLFIYGFFTFLVLAIGVQFGLICLLVKDNNLSATRILGISGGWALCEWARLYFFSGYTWNPSGMALSGTLYGMQLASVVGVFGMSFWIFLTNLFALKWLTSFTWQRFTLWTIVALTPYLFGWMHITYHDKQMAADSDHLNALLVQTSIYPEYKLPLNGSEPLSPHQQWERILTLLLPYSEAQPDLIVVSEGAVPYGAHQRIYSQKSIEASFHALFGGAKSYPIEEEDYVANAFWGKALADQFGADVVVGLEDFIWEEDRAYNAAFLFSPQSDQVQRYEKRILLPMGEYIPFNWCRTFLARYGIQDSYTPGTEAKLLHAKRASLSLSICYEETFGHLMRENRLLGGGLLINLSNDVWYPRSRLPMVHFAHGRLRAVEAGVPLLRSCNTGVTCGVDSIGRVLGMLGFENAQDYAPAETLSLSVPLYQYPTFYTRFGNGPVIVLSTFYLSLLVLGRLFKRKPFSLKDLGVSLLRKN